MAAVTTPRRDEIMRAAIDSAPLPVSLGARRAASAAMMLPARSTAASSGVLAEKRRPRPTRLQASSFTPITSSALSTPSHPFRHQHLTQAIFLFEIPHRFDVKHPAVHLRPHCRGNAGHVVGADCVRHFGLHLLGCPELPATQGLK